MAVQSSFYTTDGTTRTFPSTKHIATKQHCAVYLKRVSDSVWEIVSTSLFSLVNNSVVFTTAPSILTYSSVEVRVADEVNELTVSPSDIALVAGSITSINTIATHLSKITTVAPHVTQIDAVGNSITNVNAVAADLTNINYLVSNLTPIDNVSAHLVRTDNPHTVTKAQVGLGNVDNTSDLNKPISTATQTALNGKANTDSATGVVFLSSGTTAQRPVLANGVVGIRYNTDLLLNEIGIGTAGATTWKSQQEFLVSGTNIKTINGSSVLGSGNLSISATQIYPIAASVAANALTVAINPTALDFRSTTLTDGSITTVTIPLQITLTVPSGATLGTANGIQARLAILAINNAGTVEVAIINTIGAGSLNESGVISTTAISAAATSSNVYYSTTARTNVAYRVVGYIEITEATAGTWATAPSLIQGIGGRAFSKSPNLLAERIITGAAVTSIDFSGLDMTAHKSYRIEIDWVNNTANTPDMYVYINNDTTLTNYYSQICQSFSTTVNAVNINNSRIGSVSSTSNSMIRLNVLMVVGSYARVQSRCSYNQGASKVEQTIGIDKTASVSNITQLTFASSVASCISPGTAIRIYRGDV